MNRAVLVLVLLLLSGTTAWTQESVSPAEKELACKKRLITVCSETEQGSPICEMIYAKREVTRVKLNNFIQHVGKLVEDKQAREDLTCARLMGQQRFVDFPLTADRSPSSGSSDIRLQLDYSDRYMKKIFDDLKELEKIGMTKYYPNWNGGKITFNGFIRKVQFLHTAYGSFDEAIVHVDNVLVDAISVPVESTEEPKLGFQRPPLPVFSERTPQEWARITSESLKKAYKELME